MNLDEVTEAMNHDLATKDGAEAIAVALMNSARDFYNENGWHPWIAHILATRTVAPEQPIPPGTVGILTIIADQIAGDSDRDVFELGVRTMVERGRAIGVMVITEAFFLKSASLGDMASIVASGTVRDHPGRCEGLVARLEHIRSHGCWLGEQRDKRVEAFERIPQDMVPIGRFTDLLRKERFA